MTARDLNDIGLRCPDCSARLVYADVREYRCTGKKCGGLYAFSLCPVEGIVLTPKDGPLQRRRRDALPTTEQHPARHLALVTLSKENAR